MTPQTNFALSAVLCNSFQRCTKSIARAIALSLTCAITACGPGTGGTGVGPVSGTYISASTATGAPSVIGVATPTSPSLPTSPSSPALPTAASGSYALVLDPLAIRLTGACLAFSFDGAWAESGGEIKVTGSYRLAAPGSDLALAQPQAGTLIARAENSGYNVTLLDARGLLLLSFTTGARVADGALIAPTPACKSLLNVASP